MNDSKEAVNHPSHYKANGMEAIDVIESFSLNFHLGNVVKYILRCGKKDDEIQELRKARWYLTREIDRREKEASLDNMAESVLESQGENQDKTR